MKTGEDLHDPPELCFGLSIIAVAVATPCPCHARQIRPRRRRNQFSVCLEPSVVAGGWWIKPSLAALPLFVVVIVQVVFTRGRVVRGFTPGLEREGRRRRRRHLSTEEVCLVVGISRGCRIIPKGF